MENTKKLNPTESLSIISEAINKTKENIKDQSFYYILWGWLSTIASFAHYLLAAFTKYSFDYLPWLILIPLGWIASIWYGIKKSKNKSYETYIELFLKHLWIVVGLSFIVGVFICVSLKINPTPIALLLAAIGTLISGLTLKFKPLSIGGVLLFIFSIVSLFIETSNILLLHTIALVSGYLIPAYLLKNYKSNV